MSRSSHEALIMIDMQNGFINEESSLCISGAKKTVPVCAGLLEAARSSGRMVIIVNRRYRADGSDVEKPRYDVWLRGGKPLSPGCPDAISAENPDELQPQPEDHVLIKPRYSAFFYTELDLLLRRKGITRIYLIGTTTPNCIRTTCYDGISLDYDVSVIEDGCSSNSEEIQSANMEDMRRAGAEIVSSVDIRKNWES